MRLVVERGSMPYSAVTQPQKAGNALFHRGVAEHAGVTELHEDRALGVLGVVAGDANVAHLVRGAFAGAHDCILGLKNQARSIA
jgi:hypothetical protein